MNADEGQLAQVIQNLVLNASEAMPRGHGGDRRAKRGHPGGRQPAGARRRGLRPDRREGRGRRDTGQHLARIFDPYFTTKQQGSGLGLATSYSIVRSHDGFIEVGSRLGEGSVFSVYLPASHGGVLRRPKTSAAAGGGTGTVLLMDDEGMVRDVAAKMIASLGHHVSTAATGEEAIEQFGRAREEGRPFDLVILDLTVKSGMGGEEAIRRLRELDPGRQGRGVERVLGCRGDGGLPTARLHGPFEQAVPARCPEGVPRLTAATARRGCL